MNNDFEAIRQNHPRFAGNPADLTEFLVLCHTANHSSARGEALTRWLEYNTVVRRRFPTRPRRKGPVRKGDYIYDAREVDLRGADIGVCCLGRVNLRAARLDNAGFEGAMFKAADFKRASFRNARLARCLFLDADLREADFCGADLREARLEGARLEKAKFDATTKLSGASFEKANLAGAVLTGADLSGVDLRLASLVSADLRGANLCSARVYGCSAWDVSLDDEAETRRRLHSDLSIDPYGGALPSTDSLELAQFVCLLLNNPKLRSIIDTITARGVLLLGRFTPERKAVLDALRSCLRDLGFYPILFDFATPDSRDTRETVKTLAGLSAFVVADVTDASSVPLELETLVSDFVMPFVVIKEHGRGDFAMIDTLYHRAPDRLSPRNAYEDINHLLANVKGLADWAMAKARELAARKRDYPPEVLLPRK